MYRRIISSLRSWRVALTAILLPLALAGCGSSGSSTPAPTAVTLTGVVTFPAGNTVGKAVVKTVAAPATPPTVEIRTLVGALVTSVTATDNGDGSYTYTVANLVKGDYVVKAVSGAKVVKALLDQGALETNTRKDINSISSTAVILAEQKIGVPPGTIGETSNSAVTSTAVATIQPAVLENTVKSAVNAVLFAPATATKANIDLANLANVVAASVYTGVDPAKFLNGTVTTPVTTTQYTLVSGTATANTSFSVSTATAQSSLTSAATVYTPPPADSVSFTSKVYEYTTSAAGAPLPGVSVTTSGLTPEITTTTDANGQYVLAGIPKNTSFTVKMSLSAYADSYSNVISLTANRDGSDRPYALFPPAKLTSWGNTAGNGVIRSRVVDSTNEVSGYIGGAVVTAKDSDGVTTYPVKYVNSTNNSISSTMTSTDVNGTYIIVNVPAGRTVEVTASKSGYTFNTKTFLTHADALSQGRLVGTASSTFSQADLTGNWNFVHFYTGPGVAAGTRPGWVSGTSAVAANGDVTITSMTYGNKPTNPTSPIDVPAADISTFIGGNLNWAIDATGKITETGTAAFATSTTPAPLQISSNKQIVVGVASVGADRVLRVAVKQGTFSSADFVAGSFVESQILSGNFTEWVFARGTTGSTGNVTYTSNLVAPSRTGYSGPFGTSKISSTGLATNTAVPAWRGIMTPDKKMIFGVGNSPFAGNGYLFNVISMNGQTFTQADLAGNWRNFAVANETTPVWHSTTDAISSAGLRSVSSYLDSNGSTSTTGQGGETVLLDSTGLLTVAADSSVHGFMSADKKLAIVTSTWSSGVYGINLLVR